MKSAQQQINEKWPSILKGLSHIASQHQDEFMDCELVGMTKVAMSEKLAQAREKGRGGWWSDDCDTEVLKQMLTEHVEKGDMRDVINFAAMIFYRESAGIGK